MPKKEKKKMPHFKNAKVNSYDNRILKLIKDEKGKPIPYKVLLKKSRGNNFDFKEFTNSLEGLKRKGELNENRDGLTIQDKSAFVKCEIVKLNKTYGFARNIETAEDIFIPGRFLLGALPKDVVLVRTSKGTGSSPEGEVMEILEENFSNFTGVIIVDTEDGMMKIVPDTLSKYAMIFENPLQLKLQENDKVMAQITERGKRHSDHKCQIVSDFGTSLKASACALSVIELNGLTPVFPSNVIAEAKKVSDSKSVGKELPKRLDLRDEPIFTIDGADTKDIDDAISIKRTENGYELGVHIADVSHYVLPKSELDNEAFERGTSVYYANRVIPMLPTELSNGICSLNPQVDRLAFSCIAQLDANGLITDFRFVKTVIRSRVKGVYSEINQIITNEADDTIMEKYKEVIDCIPLMLELHNILQKNKIARGAPSLDSVESKLVISDDDVCYDVIPRQRGVSEEIIENLMLCANECAAKFGLKHDLPFVYRVHEDPPEAKREALIEGLTKLGISINIGEQITPRILSDILNKSKGTNKEMVVNNLVLRSMAKAKYSVEPIGHFGLVLADYAHFTSPIRRYPDLTIHRIMSDFLENNNNRETTKKFDKFSKASADQSTKTELVAVSVERECEDCYKAEYLSNHIGEEFDGLIISVMEFGFFIVLPNTCEGLVRVENLNDGEYAYDGSMTLRNLNTGASYTVGQSVRIKVENTNVSSGRVDFSLA